MRRAFITNNNLKSNGQINLTIQGVNSKSHSRNHKTYDIKIPTKNGPVMISCAEVNELPTINMLGISEIAKELTNRQIKIADPP